MDGMMDMKEDSVIKISGKTLTILTTTFNRGHLLNRLYNSLVSQKAKDFIWVVVNDGSFDDTEKVVSEFVKEDKIEIYYLFKVNGGKQKAVNYVVPYIETQLTMIVDSDDYLTENAVETIILYSERYRYVSKLCGFSFLRRYPDGKINNKMYPCNEMIGNYIQCRVNMNIGGDRAEVFYTQCLREFPFPEYPDEMFINEDVAWIKMALSYDLVHVNKAIYTAEYLEDGLTKRGKFLKAKNPLGGMERGVMMMLPQCKTIVRIKGALFYIVFGKFAHKKRKEMLDKSPNKRLIRMLYPFGFLIYVAFFIRFKVKN